MKHLASDLVQMQSLPLEAKIIMSQQRIRQWYDNFDGMVYVSFSGGKDSTVLKHLVETTSGISDVPSVFVNTGLEYPEIQKFAMSQPNVTTVRPTMRFDEVIKEYGYPVVNKEIAERLYYGKRGANWALQALNGLNTDGTESQYRMHYRKWKFLLDAPFDISHKCCDIMKKHPAKRYEKMTKRKPILGTLACESGVRRTQWMKYGCNVFEGRRPVSKPMSFWTEQDVLQYLVEFNLPYADIYGDIKQDDNGTYYNTGVDRTGCMFCMFGCHLDKTPNRFQRMKETHPRQYQYCMENLGLKEVLEYIGVDYE